jgi:hypothetical protein
MIIVQVFAARNFFLLRRGIAARRTLRGSRFRMAQPRPRCRTASAATVLVAAISALRHRRFREATRKGEKKAPPHLGRTRAECL